MAVMTWKKEGVEGKSTGVLACQIGGFLLRDLRYQ